jgi:hypothetical protein
VSVDATELGIVAKFVPVPGSQQIDAMQPRHVDETDSLGEMAAHAEAASIGGEGTKEAS